MLINFIPKEEDRDSVAKLLMDNEVRFVFTKKEDRCIFSLLTAPRNVVNELNKLNRSYNIGSELEIDYVH